MNKSNLNKEIQLLFHSIRAKELNSRESESTFRVVDELEDQEIETRESLQALATEMSSSHNLNTHELLNLYDDMGKDAITIYNLSAKDVLKGIEKEHITFKLFTLQGFLDHFILKGEENEPFMNLFNSLDEKGRIEYLENNYLCDYDIYYTNSLSYLVLFEVNEEALKENNNIYIVA